MNYLKYIEHNAELLQFYLWFRDYEARFAALPESEMVLSPAWKGTQNEADAAGNEPDIAGLRHPDFAGSTQKVPTAKADPFDTPDKTPSLEEEKREGMSSEYATSSSEGRTTRSGTTYQSVASSAFDDAGLKWKPCKCTFLLHSPADPSADSYSHCTALPCRSQPHHQRLHRRR